MKRWIVANWKMNGDSQMAATLAESVMQEADLAPATVRTVVCPPSVYLPQLIDFAAKTRLECGAQDCHGEESGAFTGNISAVMLADIGAKYVIVGHSERREYHGETDAMVKAKAEAALRHGLTPVICVGEDLQTREAGQAEAVVGKQVEASLPDNPSKAHFLLAYEPVWAIGSGKTPTIDDIHSMHAHIDAVLAEKTADGQEYGVLYGGSVKAANAREILQVPKVDGVLVGGASLKADEFCSILQSAV